MKRSISAAARFAPILLLSPVLMFQQGCTNLDEDPSSAITPDNFYQNEEEVLGGLAGVYAQLRNTIDGYYNVSLVSSDEMIVPTRGQDWFDNGRWLELHRQTWEANSPAGLADVNAVWNDAFTGVARANALLAALENATVPNKEVMQAEARTLRAFFYYQLIDMFGGVPIVDSVDIAERPRAPRSEVFQFIVSELEAVRTVLPASWDAGDHGRMTAGAADAILANMWLNAGVFARDDGVSATSYNSCTAVTGACDAAIAAADRVLNSPEYTLAADDTEWRSNFTADNENGPENILVVKYLNQSGLGLNLVMRTLHYNQFNPSPWNGFAILADAYNAFDLDDDQRTQIFLVGPQVNLETGEPVNDRSGDPLVFTPTINDATAATESEGVRVIKYPPDPNHVAQENGNDFVYFRLGEMVLIKAEALNELTPGSGTALQLLNDLRARVFDPDEPLGSIDRDVILNERLFELTWEIKRRQDLIRHGKFTAPWAFKEQREDYRILMPIPQTQLDVNPELTQNSGY